MNFFKAKRNIVSVYGLLTSHNSKYDPIEKTQLFLKVKISTSSVLFYVVFIFFRNNLTLNFLFFLTVNETIYSHTNI